MEAVGNWWRGSAPDKEPPASVLADWKSYQTQARGGAAAAAAPKDAAAAAEEGGGGGFLSGVLASVSGAAASMQNAPSATQMTYAAAFAAAGVLFLLLAFFVFLPLIVLSPHKFALTFTVGSSLVLASLGALRGPRAAAAHLLERERRPFAAAYLGSLAGTLYASLVMHSYIFSITFCGAQVVTLVYFVASYFPGGAAGAQYVVSAVGRGGLSLGGALARSVFSGGK